MERGCLERPLERIQKAELEGAGEPLSRVVELGTGLRYHVLEWGADRPELDHTVLLLHGFLDLAWGWAATVRAGLARRFHVIAPDLRGHGDTGWVGPGAYYHFIDYLADVDEVARAFGRTRLSVVGHSMGGSVAAYFAGSFPERVHRLALLEGLGPPDSDAAVPDRVRVWLDGWRRARAREPSSYAGLDEAAARLRAHDPLLGEELARELARHGTRSTADGRLRFKHDPLHLTMGPNPFRVEYAAAFWRRVTCPVLVVEGDASVFRAAGAEMERRLGFFPSAPERAVLSDAGHMMQRHQPVALAEMLAGFLARRG
jgi:pimeloyl-ACP methyl ester carboxylesterase